MKQGRGRRLFPAIKRSQESRIESVASIRDRHSLGSELCLCAWKLKESPGSPGRKRSLLVLLGSGRGSSRTPV